MESQNQKPTIIVIAGVTGDLAKRKLLPSLAKLKKAKVLPEKLKIIGTSRHQLELTDFLNSVPEIKDLVEVLDIKTLDLNQLNDAKKLHLEIKRLIDLYGKETQVLINLSVPPIATLGLINSLADANFSDLVNLKLLLEKPFGTDLSSAKELILEINKHFKAEQIYRIDHYLAKEMVQNILIFRDKNYLFKHTINNQFIEKIEILATESIDIENRVNFFEQTGTLRDLVQSHLLQLTALTLLDLNIKNKSVRELRAKALAQLSLAKTQNNKWQAIRGQYANYKDEVKNPNSFVETFVAITLNSNDPNWQNIPITLISGKSLNEKRTEIRLYYKNTTENNKEGVCNKLTLRIQPKPGIDLVVLSKVGGYQNKIEENILHMDYFTEYEVKDSYEQVLLDAIYSNHDLFISDEEVLESWRILDALQKQWLKSGDDLIIYKKNSKYEEIIKIAE